LEGEEGVEDGEEVFFYEGDFALGGFALGKNDTFLRYTVEF
jgi:hypothetical protein